ncbi:MAG: helicase HerA-like domain-containing protein [Chitinophagales bacterium]
MSDEKFRQTIEEGYTFKGKSIDLGAAMLNGQPIEKLLVKAPLRTFNRHGLIAGATGTGKTKTLQHLAETLSSNGVSVVLMDIKGDLSGIAVPGTESDMIKDRSAKIGIEFKAHDNPVEFLTLSNEKGARLRATVSEFGPVLFSKILELNETQQSVVALLFKYCDDNKLPLLDLKDFKKVLNFATAEGAEEIEKTYGKVSSATTATILRKIIELEQQGGEKFFGEKSFEVDDLIRFDDKGRGLISIVRLTDIQDKPKLFSTFMLCMLAEIYSTFPEEGDSDQPKLVIFIDEAHLIFDEASSALLDQIETIIKLIRSKGVGIFFCTQNPADIPDSVLAQLGMKVQHALRAFTAKDRKSIKLAAENYPETEFYKVEEHLTALGIGEAFVTVLNEKGIPTPLAATMMAPPCSRMDVLTPAEIEGITGSSKIVKKYNEEIDRESAFEILNAKLNAAAANGPAAATGNTGGASNTITPEKSTLEKAGDFISDVAGSTAGKIVMREVTRGILGVLGLGGRSTTRRKSIF